MKIVEHSINIEAPPVAYNKSSYEKCGKYKEFHLLDENCFIDDDNEESGQYSPNILFNKKLYSLEKIKISTLINELKPQIYSDEETIDEETPKPTKHKKFINYNSGNDFECYIDKHIFDNERDYIQHFKKYHRNRYPFICPKCKRGFYSYNLIFGHSHNY